MIKVVILFFLVSFVLPSSPLMSVGDYRVFDYDLYQQVPFSEWAGLDSIKKNRALDSFLEKEIVYYESVYLGLDKHAKTREQLKDRYNQILVNEYYEKVVAAPLIALDFRNKTESHFTDKAFVYHLLLGFSGCSLKGSFEKTKNEAFLEAFNIRKSFIDSSAFLSPDEKISLFKAFTTSYSNDPSVETNSGELGWVSWGRTMPSFQEAVFSSSVLAVSEPVLTDFGYHLVFVSKKGFSDFFYYKKDYRNDIVVKLGLQSVPLDSLRVAAAKHDSLVFVDKNYFLNLNFVDSLVNLFNIKTKEGGLRGGKNIYIKWLEEEKKKDVLFVFGGAGFGLGWFLEKLRKTPSTRVPVIASSEDFDVLLRSFILQEEVVKKAKNEKINQSVFFSDQYLNHTKNILYKKHESFVLSNAKKIDSFLVEKKYKKGLFRGEFIKPRQAVFSEIRKNNKSIIDSVYALFLSGTDFDLLLSEFGGSLKKPIGFGGGGVFGEAVFGLSPGEVSSPLENINKTFSLVRLERFVDEEPFTLNHVYSQIKQKLLKEQKDSIRANLKNNLLKKHSAQINRGVLLY